MKLSLLSLLVLTSMLSSAQIYKKEDFIEIAYPKHGMVDSLRMQPNGINVAIVNGELQLSKHIYKTQEYILPEGKLLSLDLGEWGGGLYYKPKDPKVKQVVVNGKSDSVRAMPLNNFDLRLLGENNPMINLFRGSAMVFPGYVKSFIKHQDSLYLVASGICSLDAKGNTFIWKDLLYFKYDSVLAAAMLGDDMLIATGNSFYITYSHRTEKLLEDLQWSSLYLNSIAVKDEHHVYLGMVGGYAQIDLSTKKLSFFKLNK